MTLNFPKSIYTAAEATTASISPANASPSDGDTGTIGSHGFTFDDDRVDSNGRWVMNSGVTYSLTSGATYTWDLYKWKASNIPDSSTAVQTVDTPSSGEFLKWNGSAAVWDAETTYNTVSTSAAGLAPTLPASHGGKFLKADGSWEVPPDTDTDTTYSVGDGGLTQKNFTTTLKTKLDGIETSADVTDATNVAAAGAVMESDATTASMSFVVDEDNMSSNSDTKVPTQQSVKAYVDANAGVPASGGNFTGTVDFDGNVTQAVQAVSVLDIDCSDGNYFTKTINANSTFTVSNVPASGTAYSFTLELTHTSGTFTWWSGLEWPAGTAPTLTAGKTHLFVFVTDDGGTRWRGAALADYTN